MQRRRGNGWLGIKAVTPGTRGTDGKVELGQQKENGKTDKELGTVRPFEDTTKINDIISCRTGRSLSWNEIELSWSILLFGCFVTRSDNEIGLILIAKPKKRKRGMTRRLVSCALSRLVLILVQAATKTRSSKMDEVSSKT
uniref:Uncharacterized protein n=1 Tax=Vespula pensylvanica TaxID=30213 RepID=A0A834PCB0_VESPE|nr:hypothetical protein H0235_003623 [Vespula pensylvanica]